MPINREQRLRSLELMQKLASDQNEASVESASGERDGMPMSLYACISDSVPGPCRIDANFICQMDIGDVGYLFHHFALRPCRGLCELRISKATPGWVFQDTGSDSIRLPVTTSAFRNVKMPGKNTLAAKLWSSSKHNSQITDPEVRRITVQNGIDKNKLHPPQVEIEFVWEYEADVVLRHSVLNVEGNAPLPHGGPYRRLLLHLQATRVLI